MVHLNGLEATLIVDHAVLQEYAITTDHKNSIVACWVPSKANKTISISWQNSSPFHHPIGGYVKVDGRDCKGEKPVPRGACEERLHSEVFVSPTFTRPFMFCNLGPADAKSPCSDLNCLQGLGEISLEIWEVNPVEAHSPPHFELPPLNICDRVRKELTHCITYVSRVLRSPVFIGG
ncbi:hypothetical protein BDQ17DRAFT_625240 [Cyathus striatus]|nr:hypothetical protein BDQ17DRAFT_625240 [Cyathus striatus]